MASFMNLLPVETVNHIVQYLGTSDANRFGQTCKGAYSITNPIVYKDNVPAKTKRGPVTWGVVTGQLRVIEMAVAAGADVSAPDSLDKTRSVELGVNAPSSNPFTDGMMGCMTYMKANALSKGELLGNCTGIVWTLEFQKRDLPHRHMLVLLDAEIQRTYLESEVGNMLGFGIRLYIRGLVLAVSATRHIVRTYTLPVTHGVACVQTELVPKKDVNPALPPSWMLAGEGVVGEEPLEPAQRLITHPQTPPRPVLYSWTWEESRHCSREHRSTPSHEEDASVSTFADLTGASRARANVLLQSGICSC
ncbi:hypothetical protein B0H65DRAFT_573074 [Neurospora tetraspora]|uniref:F-box domain-containing protein n=1 Tax=Neurospora tetraspora TaxID=94610 RepID=A0AAE0JEE6_9PEZI|nr:hypothetical protein B0H65DRAFT_573074 [Neurospora tetraspora]